MKKTIQLVLAAAACAGLSALAAETAAPTNQIPMRFTLKKTQEVEVNYLLFLPRGYQENPGKQWPLILFLHGAGERGTNVWKVATHGPSKEAARRPDFPFLIVSPQCPERQVWSKDVLLALLDEVLVKYNVDRGRVYLTGLSMGGYGTWNLGLSYPERFAAIAPICGGGEMISLLLSRTDKAEALKTLGIWAFHGAKDPVVKVEESQRMVDAVKRAGAQDVRFTIYPEANHDSWTETYKNPEFYDWLLQHKR
jgi:predicted peptidase